MIDSKLPWPSASRLVACCVAVWLAASAPCTAAEPSVKPNILFVLADDLGWRDLSVEGSTFYESPHIDSIANHGVRFTQGYAACQVCSPSRASILTGKYPPRHGVTDYIGARTGLDWKRNDRVLPCEYARALGKDEVTLAEALREAGYVTFFAGKWHLGNEGSHPEDHGFDHNQGGFSAGSPRGGFFSPYRNPKLSDGPRGEHLPLRLADETVKFLHAHDRSQPFLAYLSFYSVHAPIQTTRERWAKYRARAAQFPPVAHRFRFDRTLPVRQVQDHPVYAGMVAAMDDAVGRVLNALRELKLDDNTIVVFTSDNGGVSSGDGYATSNLPLRGGKGRQWEGGVREPFYIKAPGVKPGTCDTPVSGIDFYPTLLELAGVEPPAEHHVDGVSLVPLLRGDSIAARPLFWHYPHYGNQGGEPSSIMRRGDWKLIHYWEDGRDELYHLARDPGEQRDVVKQHPMRAQAMRRSLDEWLEEVGAKIPQADSRFDAKKKADALRRVRELQQPNLERRHARFLSPDFRPNNAWWGSRTP